MCTVTVLRAPDAAGHHLVRLAANRDEQRARPEALPPTKRRFGRHWTAFPIDPASGGTWVAVNDAGLAFTLLNVNNGTPLPRSGNRLSRGLIIPALLHHDSLGGALDEMRKLTAREYGPFRLVIVDRRELVEVRSDGGAVELVQRTSIDRPYLFTSSGLGDHLVEKPRRELFERFFAAPGNRIAQQDAFHRHQWQEHPELSVRMSRVDARTVSSTIVCLQASSAQMCYQPDPPEASAPAVVVSLPCVEGGGP